MLVRIKRNTVAAGKPVAVGDIVDISDSDAGTLIVMRKAELVSADAPEEPNPILGVQSSVTQAPAEPHPEEQIKKRGRFGR